MRENRKSAQLPTVRPGQIWLIEHAPAAPLFPCDRAALTGADVVIYDRALAPVAASVLPIGAYAERLPADARPTGFAISPRALGLAADGWSVAQLVEVCRDRHARLRLASEALASLGCAGDLPVLIIAKRAPYRQRQRETCLRALPDLPDEFADTIF